LTYDNILNINQSNASCAAHGLHRIAEQVSDHFSTVDKVIANSKKVFKKEAPGVCLPPNPEITRWGL